MSLKQQLVNEARQGGKKKRKKNKTTTVDASNLQQSIQ